MISLPGVAVVSELGRGSSAITYRARRDGHDYAMKVYADRAGAGRSDLLALRREAALLTWVDHPGLTRVHEVGLAAGQAYMILDLVAGRPLADVLAPGPLGVAESVRLGRAVAEVLAAVHRVGLVHRDVKPQNIMLAPGGQARLIDFGMVARSDREVGDTAAGTFRYAAPEQTGMIKRSVDGRSDLYALGVVLFQCLTGELPFASDDTGTLLRMHAVTPAPPLGHCQPEAARLRARALAGLGRRDDALAQAAAALAAADQHGWPHRAQWIRSAFELGVATVAGLSRPAVAGSTATFSVDKQRLAAVERLSITAARILDPAELTRVALDEIIGLLGAERAYLFLTDDAGRLAPHLGRDAAGADLTTLTGYGSTLVERVRAGRAALVVTGTDEGLALGSQSVLAHGLRSIMVAPLLLDGRLLGVVYLDSRLAKGMFTEADAGVLAALTTHVATALETVRAAELAVAVQSARRERDVAETMRDATAYLSGTLDPADVLRRLHATLRRALPAGRSWLAVREGQKLHVCDEHDEHSEHDADGDPALAELLGNAAPVRGDAGDPPPAPFGAAAGGPWLSLPLRTREGVAGVVVLAAPDPAGYRDAQLEIGAALAGQGMTAYENARLFAEVQRLATTDGLTGLANRRHFFNQAVRELALARRRATPLTAVMLDIDHFKQVNDRHGHPVGDEVIAAVARRLAATARTTDVLGRYGGEEFVILLPDTGEEGSTVLAERLRAAVGDEPVDTDAGPLPVTISVGVARLAPEDSVGDLLGRADNGLYAAKRDGRNRVAVA